MKNLHILDFFRTFRQFLCRIKAYFFLSETGTYPIKKPTREGLQLLLNRFSVLIYEKVEVFTKVALENTKM